MSGRARACLAALILSAVWISPLPALAQAGAAVNLSEPDTSAFPEISLLVSVRDTNGRQFPGLPPGSFSVIEDDFLLTELQVEEVLVGTRQVYVVSSSAGMRVRDSRGRTRFDLAREALLSYWGGEPASMVGVDDLSLISGEGLLVQHSRSAAELASALAFSDPSFAEQQIGLDLLSSALDFVADPSSPAAMPGHVVFITTALQELAEPTLANVISRARESATSIHAVLMVSEEILEDPGVEGLRQLAQATGGEFVLFDPELGFSFLEQQVLGARTQYHLTYRSQVSESGTHTVQVRVIGSDLEAISPVRQFSVEVLPPQVVFIQPPVEILRESDEPQSEVAGLLPRSHTLQVLVTFPDGKARPLMQSQLFVDGELVDERNEAPFDQFEWDLRQYGVSGTHTLQSVVRDSLGLEARSVDVSVDVLLAPASGGLTALPTSMGPILAASAVLTAALILVVGMFSLARRRAESEPDQPGGTARLNPFKRARMQKTRSSQVEAHLIPLNPTGDPIPLSGLDLVLGRDASLASVVLDDPSVDGLHARLIRQAGGHYWLKDQGSVAGTWVNYALVPEDGQRLEHGDRLQLGRVEFRFRLVEAPPAREIRVYPAPQALRTDARSDSEQGS